MPKDTMPQVKQFWNDIADDFDAIYTGKGKSALTRAMDSVFRKDIYERFAWVMRKAAPVAGKSVCDIGCGSGRFVAQFAKDGAARVVGVDVAPQMLRLAEDLTAQIGVRDRCEFVLSDVSDWKTNDTFDITIAIGLWDYIADPRDRLRNIRRMTTERFLSAWPRYWTWRMPIRKVRLTLAGCPVYFYKRQDVIRLLEESGFQVVSCDVVGKLFCVDARPR